MVLDFNDITKDCSCCSKKKKKENSSFFEMFDLFCWKYFFMFSASQQRNGLDELRDRSFFVFVHRYVQA